VLLYNHVSVLFTRVCAGCNLDYRPGAILLIVKPLLNAFQLASLVVGHEVSLQNYDAIEWQQHGMIQPHQAIMAEPRSWICVLHHNQHFRFCHHLIYLNFRMQSNSTRFCNQPSLPPSLNHHLAAPGPKSPALALSTTQRHQLLCLSGHTLLLLQLLMRNKDRRGVHRHELHRALKRVSSTATAAKVFNIITRCVYIKATGRPH
jgi:hypothetical protein